MPELLSQRQYAKRLGVSATLVNRYVRQGLISLIDGRWIDPEQADHELALSASHRRRKLRFEADAGFEWPDNERPFFD